MSQLRDEPVDTVPTGALGVDHSQVPAARSVPPAWRRWCALLLPPLVWAGFTLHNYAAFVRHPSRGIDGGPDGILYGWYFQSIERSLATGHNPFQAPGMNAPHGLNLMWNTSLPLPAIICAPLTAWFGGLAVAGWLMVLAPVLAATSAYLVLRALTHRILGSALAATIYGFGPFFVGQAGHLHLTLAAPALPLLLLLGHRLFVRQTGSPVRIGLWLGVIVAATMLVSEEVTAIAFTMAAIAVGAGLIVDRVRPRERVRFAAIGLAVGVTSALILLVVPFYFQFSGPSTLGGGVTTPREQLDLFGLFRPSSLQYFARASDIAANNRYPANGAENTGYLGLPLLALIAIGGVWLIRRKDRVAQWWLLSAGIGVIFSFGHRLWINGQKTRIPLPWYAFDQLPFLRSVVTVRFSLVTTMFVAFAVAYALAQLPTRRSYQLGLLVVTACLVPLWPASGGPYSGISQIATPRFFTTPALNSIAPGSTVLILPNDPGPFGAQVPIYWQLRAGLRFNIVGGYGVFDVGGRSSYLAPLPAIATTLTAVASSGGAPSAAESAAAKATVAPSTIRYIVITDQVPHADLVTTAAAAITGCTPRRISDVVLCEVPTG